MRNDVEITPQLVQEHGLKPDEYERFVALIGRDADADRARHRLGDVERALLLQVLAPAPAHPADEGALGDPGAGRERRRHRHRRRAGLRVQDGEPQPPLLHRALPGRGDRRRRHPARRVHHGRAADRGAERAALRRARTTRGPATSSSGVVAGIGGYGNSFGVPTVGGGVGFHPRYNGNILVNAMAVGLARADEIFYAGRDGRREPDRLSRLQDRPRRHPRRHHGLGRVRRRLGGEAPHRPGRRPLRREAAARSLPRADGVGRRHRHPGHGRGGPHLLGGRDGRQGRPRRRARPRPGALPRGGHDAPTR